MEQKSRARSRVKIAVFFVLSIHVVGLMALLVQGCRVDTQKAVEDQPVAPPEVPIFETVPPALDTNKALLPPVESLPPAETVDQPPVTTLPPVETLPPVGTPVIPPPAATQEYVIKAGETFYSIGKQFGVSMKAIKEANPSVEPTRLQVGQKIVIPPPAPATAPAVVPSVSGETIYTVVSGDTLSKIAARYGTTWQAIQEINNLPTTSIKVGQKLRIPSAKAPAPGAAGGM